MTKNECNLNRENPHVSDSSSVHHQEFFTVHTAMVHVIQFTDSLRAGLGRLRPDPARKLSIIFKK